MDQRPTWRGGLWLAGTPIAEEVATNEKNGGSFFHAFAAFRSFEWDVLHERAEVERNGA